MHVKNLANQLVLNGSTSPSADLAQLDRIDEQLREAMVCIRSARNSISPANRLPPEVMSPIFAELASSARRELDPQRPVKRFMSVAAVCRHWRRAVLPCALGHGGHRQVDVVRSGGGGAPSLRRPSTDGVLPQGRRAAERPNAACVAPAETLSDQDCAIHLVPLLRTANRLF
ncbi:hypothetical protein AcV7_004937 [Taiwanofungus camphoratus]|nr:hypothetical protein AcV7_004937 [Antrodia cinnamomea]